MEPMSDHDFQHHLKLAVIFIPVLLERMIFDGDDADRHNTLNCLEIVGRTFVEMQRRLDVKPVFKIPAIGTQS